MAKSFNYNDPNAPKDNTYQANSDGVNKELGPKVDLPPKPVTQGINGIGNLSNLQNPSSGKNGISNLTHLQHPAIGQKMAKKTGGDSANGVNKKPGAMPLKTGGSSADGVNKKTGTMALKTPGDSSHYTNWPLTKFAFVVDIGGFDGEMAFQGMDGLGASIGKMEFRDGNSPKFYKQTRPTLTSYEPVTLKKGVFSGDKVLFDWFKNVSQGSMFSDMRTVNIHLCELNATGLEHMFTWTLEQAYITKYTPSTLDGEADTEIAVEEIELTYQSFSMNAGGVLGALGSLFGAAGGVLGRIASTVASAENLISNAGKVDGSLNISGSIGL